MRIVDVNPFFYPWLGGIEHRMHRIAKELVRRGHEVIIITSRLPDTAEDEVTEYGYRVIRLKSKFYKIYQPPFVKSYGLLEKLNELKPDIVNFNYRWAPSYTKDMAKYEMKKVFTYHNIYGEGTGLQKIPSLINDRIFNRQLKKYNHLIFVSDYHMVDFKNRGFDTSNATVVYPCLDELPEGDTDEGDYILTVSRLVKTKGLRYLIEAMVDIDCKLIICGVGPEEKHLKKLIEKFGLENKVEMKGFVTDEEKEKLQSRCKLTVIPSLEETFCLSAIETMSYGHPVVCTNVNGLPYTVKNGGITVNPKQPKELANAVNELLNNESKRKELGNNAKAVSNSYLTKNVVDKLIQVYEDVLNKQH